MEITVIEELQEIPFVEGGRDEQGCDCWGLVMLFYQKAYGFDLPKFEDIYYKSAANYEVTVDGIEAEKAKQGLFTPVEEGSEGDVVLLNAKGRPLHMGIVLDSMNMIHTAKLHGVVIESYKGAKWKNRIVGLYRLKR